MKNIFLQLSVVAIFIFIVGCQNNDDIKEIEQAVQTLVNDIPTVKNDNGILVFKDEQSLNQTINNLQNMNKAELNDWYSNLGFNSIYQRFQIINDAEWAISDYYEKMSPEELKNSDFNPEKPVISQEYKMALEEDIIREFIDSDGSINYELNLHETGKSYVLNDDFALMVGSTLYKYGIGNRKLLKNAQISDLHKLETASKSNAEDSLFIIYYNLADARKEHLELENARINHSGWGHDWYFYSPSSSGYNYDGDWKMRGWITGNSYLGYPGTTHGSSDKMYVNFVLGVKIMKKNIWGNYKVKSDLIKFYANWNYKYKLQDINDYNYNDLPDNSSLDSPYSYQAYLDNDEFNLNPNTNGYYYYPIYNCGDLGLCGGFEEAVNLTSMYAYLYWHGKYWYFPEQSTYYN